MFRVLRHALKAGIVTAGYPDVPDPAPAGFRGKPELRAGACQGDAACVAACPAGALLVEQRDHDLAWQIDYGRCVFCGWCEDACPNGAIVLTTEYELTARDRAALVRRTIVPRPANGAARHPLAIGGRS